jgi:hypothetical protein
MPFDYEAAKVTLAAAFAEAEEEYRNRRAASVPAAVEAALATLFNSNTQAFREALIGCCLARMGDAAIDIAKPYVNQGSDAYNGRTLDEQVVNPLLQEKEVPCSKGPYLSALRRNISFVPETSKGLRDKDAFRAMLVFIDCLKTETGDGARRYLVSLLRNFITLRERSRIALARINRFSIEQYSALLDLLLGSASGGLVPVLLVVSAFDAIKATYGLPWELDYQGINEADAASGAGGDVTVRRAGEVVLSIEVTERIIDEDRVRTTFRTKIAPNGIDDYLFFFAGAPPTEAARARARAYFAQGHDINFAPVKDWIATVLATLGAGGRKVFTDKLVAALDDPKVPAAIKVAWNSHVRTVLA